MLTVATRIKCGFDNMASSKSVPSLALSSSSITTYNDWQSWKRELEYYLEAKDITDPARKKAVLLHRGGRELQEIFSTLEQPASVPRKSSATGTATDKEEIKVDHYQVAVDLLEKHFKPSTNRCYERFLFRQIRQGSDSIEQFVVRLRKQAANCKFHALDEAICDQIIDGCADPMLRQKILEQKLEKVSAIVELGKLHEAVNVQTKAMVGDGDASQSSAIEAVARVSRDPPAKTANRSRSPSDRDRQRRRCTRCNSSRHSASDESCPARDSTCHRCQKKGHWSNCCRSRVAASENESSSKTDNSRSSPKGSPARATGKPRVRALQRRLSVSDGYSSDSSGGSNAFQVSGDRGRKEKVSNRVSLRFDSVWLNPVIDSGADVNLIDPATWRLLTRQRVRCSAAAVDTKVYPYGRKAPLKLSQAVWLRIRSRSKSIEAKFFILADDEGDYETIVGRELAVSLEVLRIGEKPASVSHLCIDPPDLPPNKGKLTGVQLKIPLDQSVVPVVQPCRRIPLAVRKKVSRHVKNLIKEDVCEEVSGEPSEWISPIVPIIKKNGDLRLCIDMRQANRAVRRERYPIPTFEELTTEMTDCEEFSRIDLKDAYHQVELTPESRKITTFVTPDGVFRFKRLYCGIRCAPKMFQRLMTNVLEGLDNVKVFFDDIIVYSRTKADHERHVKAVLNRLKERGLVINLDKSVFGVSEINFLGHTLSKNSIRPNESNSSAIRNFEAPQNKKDVQSFLGLTNYVARFIPDFSSVTEPLRRLIKKNSTFRWSEAQQSAFESLKKSIENVELKVLHPEATVQIYADASPVGLGAVLLQQKPGNDRPEVLGFASRSLSVAEQNYSQIEREALGLVWACERFRMYTLGKRFVLYTDHKPLEILFGPRSKPNARIERWVLRLQNFDYVIKYVEGAKNIADSFSRLGCKYPNRSSYASSVKSTIYHVTQAAIPKALTLAEFKTEADMDTELGEIRLALLENQQLPPEYARVKYELSVADTLVLRGDRLIPPKSLRPRILAQAYEGHPGIEKMKQRLRTKVWWPFIDKEAEAVVKTCHSCLAVSSVNPPEKMSSTALPQAPWDYVAIDHMGPFPDGRYLLVLVDYFSRFIEAVFVEDVSASSTKRCLMSSFARFGLPNRLKSDNARAFVGLEFENFLSEFGIIHVTSPPLWPQANGEVERQNRSILKCLQIAAMEKRSLEEELAKYLLFYHGTPHSSTLVAPAELMLRRKIRDKLPALSSSSPLFDEVKDADTLAKEKGRKYADSRRRAVHREISEGDFVLMPLKKSNKLTPAFDPEPYQVIHTKPGEVIVSREGKTFRRSTSAVKLVPNEIVERPGSPERPAATLGSEIPALSPSREAAPSFAEVTRESQGWPGWATAQSRSPAGDASPRLPLVSGESPYRTRSGRSVNPPSRLSY